MVSDIDGRYLGMHSDIKCTKCSKDMIWNHHRTYKYCIDHPTKIVYDELAWRKKIQEDNRREAETFRKLNPEE